MAKEPNIEQIIADHKIGKYSQRKLAQMHNVSLGFINKTIKNIDKVDAEVVNAGIAYRMALAERNEQSVNTIEHAVNEATKHLLFFNNSALKNQTLANKLLDRNMKIGELEAHSRLTAKNKETVIGKSADTVINNENTQNTAIKISIDE